MLHRDLKTSNILLNNRGELKLCDFGMARSFGDPLRPYTQMVVTLWYRPPELLLGATVYSTAVDVWSAGCVLAELLLCKPLFEGRSEIEQINKIFALLGAPTSHSWPGFAELPITKKVKFSGPPASALHSRFHPAQLSPNGLALLASLLSLDPERRPSCEQALAHPWFAEIPLPKEKDLLPTRPALNDASRRGVAPGRREEDPLVAQARREALGRAMGGRGGLFSFDQR